MIYYTSRDLSKRLSIHPEKWKRWARAFLPPDPLGGLQSGVARQFSIPDAFKVYLGGYLVGRLRFTMPEAEVILSDLAAWLKKAGFLDLNPLPADDILRRIGYHRIYIIEPEGNGFAYVIRTLTAPAALAGQAQGQACFRQIYMGTCEAPKSDSQQDPLLSEAVLGARVVTVSALYGHFLRHLQAHD
ncbi:MAG: hypothetical protein HKP58_19410 [Desulfatitalea sp.]|nr:hypothetical protein [Desulfatitalea sp.]NNK02585.1 hypothetical protein [Desulfatitalea sp.]